MMHRRKRSKGPLILYHALTDLSIWLIIEGSVFELYLCWKSCAELFGYDANDALDDRCERDDAETSTLSIC
jgi:hypothetical protein